MREVFNLLTQYYVCGKRKGNNMIRSWKSVPIWYTMSVNMKRAERRQNVRHFLYTFMNDCDTENAAEKTMGSKYVPKYIKYGLLGALKKNDSKVAYNKIAKLGMFIDNSCNELVYYNSLATSVVRWTVTMSIDSEQIRTVFERVIAEVGQITDDDIRFILEKYKYQEERQQAGYCGGGEDGIMSFLKPKAYNPATSLIRYYGSSVWMKLMRSILRNAMHIFTENTFTIHRDEEQQQDDESTNLMDEFKSTRTNVITASETRSREKMSRLLESDDDSSGEEMSQNRDKVANSSNKHVLKAGRPINPPKNTITCFDVEEDDENDDTPTNTNPYYNVKDDEDDYDTNSYYNVKDDDNDNDSLTNTNSYYNVKDDDNDNDTPTNTSQYYNVKDDEEYEDTPTNTTQYSGVEDDGENDDDGSDSSKETVIENINGCANQPFDSSNVNLIENLSVQDYDFSNCDAIITQPNDIVSEYNKQLVNFDNVVPIVKRDLNNIVSEYKQQSNDTINVQNWRNIVAECKQQSNDTINVQNWRNIVSEYKHQSVESNDIEPTVTTATTTTSHVHFDKKLKDFVLEQSKKEAFELVQRFGPSTSIHSRFMRRTYATTVKRRAIAARKQTLQTRKCGKQNRKYILDGSSRPIVRVKSPKHKTHYDIPKLLAIEDTAHDNHSSSTRPRHNAPVIDSSTTNPNITHFDKDYEDSDSISMSDKINVFVDSPDLDSDSISMSGELNMFDNSPDLDSNTYALSGKINIFDNLPDPDSIALTNSLDSNTNALSEKVNMFVNPPDSDSISLSQDTGSTQSIVSKYPVNYSRKYKYKNPIFEVQ